MKNNLNKDERNTSQKFIMVDNAPASNSGNSNGIANNIEYYFLISYSVEVKLKKKI